MNIFRTSSGKIVIQQKPNAPILGAFVSWVLSNLTNGEWSSVFGVVASTLLVYWATLEILWGVNTWRRILGAFVLSTSLRGLFEI